MATNIRPSNTPATGGTDFRVDATNASREDFSSSVWRRPNGDGNPLGNNIVEVQAFLPSRPGGAIARTAVVTIALHLADGMADVMLSPDEASEVASALRRAVDEAYDLGRPSPLAQILHDYGVDPDYLDEVVAKINAL